MSDAKFLSKERVERDGYLVYAEGAEIPLSDTAELVRQGHLTQAEVDAQGGVVTARFPSLERVERDGVLIYSVGDEIPVTDVDELARQGYELPAADAPKAPAKRRRK